MKRDVKKIATKIIFSIILIFLIVLVGLYVGDSTAREWMDKNLLRKSLEESELTKIEIEEGKNTKVFSYGNYVATLVDNSLSIYNQYARKLSTITVQVTNPKVATNGDYLLLSDEGQSNIYLIYGESLQWQKELEGDISQICVNKNGAVGVSLSGTTFKSVIIMFDITGEENFKTYLSTTIATDLAISEDSQYLSFIEINTSGASIFSTIKTVSVEKAKNNPQEAIIYTYNADTNVLLLKIKYKKDKIIGFADDSIHIYSNGNDEKIFNIDKNISFVDINIEGSYVAYIKETSESLLNSQYELDILNVENEKTNVYYVKENVKSIYCSEHTIAVNLGNEIDFVDTNGWLIKKYNSLKNVKEIVVGKKIAAIVYKDKIELVNI